MDEIAVRPLRLADAHQLAPLLAAYTQDQKRGAPRPPDQYYAELLLKDPVAEIVGAWQNGRLVGFAVYLDLPDTMSGLRAGQLDDLFVIQDAREHGIGHVLVEAVVAQGEKRGWTHLRWMVPGKPTTARLLAEKMAEKGPWESYVVRFETKGVG
jgi:GNAT superfamily N-acetyltransferase